MDAIEAIKTRRSVRSFTEEPVDEATVKLLLEAAMDAPSAHHEEPWHLVVVTDRAMLDKIAAANHYAAMAARAPLAIVVCGDSKLDAGPGFWPQDCAAATQNLLLAAHALGLGAVWTGAYPHDEIVAKYRALFDLPAGVYPLSLVVIGHTTVRCEEKPRFRGDRVHRNVW